MRSQQWAVIGDLHLNKLRTLIPDHLERQQNTLHTILDQVQEQGLDNVVLLGDVFDVPNPATEVLLALLHFLNTYSNVHFTWLMGNHDRHSGNAAHMDLFVNLSELKHLPNLTVVTAPTKVGNVSWLPYPHKTPLAGTDLVFAHVDRPGAQYDNGMIVKGDEWDTRHHWIIGHIHKPQRMGTHTYYTGTPYQLSFGEVPNKHWAHVTITGKGSKFQMTYTPHAIPPPYVLKPVTLTKMKHFAKVSQEHEKHSDTWFRLKVAKGLQIPNTFLRDHPRCSLAVNRSSTPETTKIEFSDDALYINPLDGLVEYLASKGLNKKQIKWATKYAKKAASRAGETP